VAAGVEEVEAELPLSPLPDFSAGFDSDLVSPFVSGLVSEDLESLDGPLLLEA
jgi:hypothetical protein